MERQYGSAARVIGVILVIGLIWGLYRYVSSRRASQGGTPTPTVAIADEEKMLEEETRLTVPDEGEKATLRDVSIVTPSPGVTRVLGLAVARRVRSGNVTEVSITANLPDPAAGSFYEGWIVKGDEKKSLGVLVLTKGGYLIEKSFSEDVSGYSTAVVTLETKKDGEWEKKVMEGTF